MYIEVSSIGNVNGLFLTLVAFQFDDVTALTNRPGPVLVELWGRREGEGGMEDKINHEEKNIFSALHIVFEN